jgi:hypothetical protein
MLSAIMTKAGADTGVTLFGPSDMQLSRNTTVKVIEGHYTAHTKAIITNPKNVYILRDIQCDGYLMGCDTTWFGQTESESNLTLWPETAPTNEDDTYIQNVQANLRERLEYSREFDNKYASMLAFAYPSNGDGSGKLHFNNDSVYSICGQRTPYTTQAAPSADFPGGEEFSKSYNDLFQLNQILYGIPQGSVQTNAFLRVGAYNNSFVFRGPHRVYNQYSDTHFEHVTGMGHFGPDAMPGDARWRDGEAIDINSARHDNTVQDLQAMGKQTFQAGVYKP